MAAGFEFSHAVIQAAWERCDGHCECRRKSHGPPIRCNKRLSFKNRGRGKGPGEWEANHRNRNLPGTLSNCEILCVDCHKGTGTFGKPHLR